MSSWEADADASVPTSGDSEDGGGAAAPPGAGPAPTTQDPVVTTPDPAVPVPPASPGLGVVPGDERGVDPFPSTGSLVWAPEPTEPVPIQPPDASASPGQITPPPSPAYAARNERPAHFARRVSRGAPSGPRRWPRADRRVLGAVGVVLIVAVAALVLLRDRDGSDGPGQPATASPSAEGADAGDPAGPILGSTGVIGSWSGSDWLPRPEGEQPGADLEYTILGLGGSLDTARGEATAEDCPAERATSGTDVAVDLAAGGDAPPAIAVAGVAEPRPRPVEQLGTDAPVYLQSATEVAAGLGASTPATLTQLLRADLDGNGTDEIIVAAEHISDRAGLSPTAGDWSAVFLRRVASGGVATEVLASSVVEGGGGGAAREAGEAGGVGPAGDGIERIQVATLADLNRDGTMEVALAGRSAAGEWTAIHALDADGVPSEVLRAGCEG